MPEAVIRAFPGAVSTGMKRWILFFDGTWKRADDGPRASNVVRLMRRVAPSDGDVQQVVYYDRGVGSGGPADRLLGGAFGRGLADNVLDAYTFLGNNWRQRDEIFLFGFSRGAFTARSLAGFLGASGLLGRETLGRLPDAWNHYRTRPDKRVLDPQSDLGSEPADIACLGVWDTVGSLGVPGRWAGRGRARRHGFHDTSLGDNVGCALHAVAIDERRRPFTPTLWSRKARSNQVVEQVWMPGVHSDVGGGYDERGLAAQALEWMVDRVQAHTDLALESADAGLADPMGLLHDSMAWWYRLLGRHRRPIAAGGARGSGVLQSLHPGAVQRFEKAAPRMMRRPAWLGGPRVRDEEYRPRNLAGAIGQVPEAPLDEADVRPIVSA